MIQIIRLDLNKRRIHAQIAESKKGIPIYRNDFTQFTGGLAAASETGLSTAEPGYCNPATFKKFEVKYTGRSPSRLHTYKIGKLILAGMAVGNSSVQDVIGVAMSAAPNSKAEKYCTWYWNDGNTEAEKTFQWHNLPRPQGSDTAGMTKTWIKLMGDEFHSSQTSFVSCAVDYGYIGQGCNGMAHRGPSVHAMILSYAGCSPQNSVKIANQIWGENGISVSMRESLAKAAADLAAQNPDASNALKGVMAGQ